MRVFLLSVFCCLTCLKLARAAAGPIAWAVPSLTRVGQTDSAGSTASITLYAARGETQSFQVIVQSPAGGLTNVNVSASDLTGPGGAVIPSSYQITLYSEHYVTVTNGSYNPGGANQPLPPGLFPDALIPFLDPVTHQPLTGATYTAVPFSLAAGRNQPIWIDIAVPLTATPGAYTGTVTITSAQGSAACSITLNVWHFTLPVAPTLKSSFGYHPPQNGVKADEELLIANRIMPFQINASDSLSLTSEGLNLTGLPFFDSENLSQCTLSGYPSAASLSASMATYPSGLSNYFYAADEIQPCVGNSGFVSSLTAASADAHAAGTKVLVTVAPQSELFNDGAGRSVVDIWTMLPNMYVNANPSDIQTALSRGNEIWMYNAQVQDTYSPKWEVDFAPINYRIVPGFEGQTIGFTGMLYSTVDLWTSDPWNNIDNPGGGNHFNGEDILVYPGAQAGVSGVVPSMRLKYLRDGVNDFEYIQMLKNQGQGTWAMGLVNTVVTNWSTWSQDPVLLESVRQQLGAKLDQLAGGGTQGQQPATLLFKSGFENNTSLNVLTGPPPAGSPAGTSDAYQYFSGSDASTGFSWPMNLWGTNPIATGLHLITYPTGGQDINNFMTNSIVSITGHTGAQTKALQMKILNPNSANGCCAQDTFQMANFTAPPAALYQRFWMRLNPEAQSQAQANPGTFWRAIWEIKTVDDVRITTLMTANGWTASCDTNTGSGKYNQTFWTASNTTVPIPWDQWFLVEVYVNRTHNSTARYYMAINGQTLFDIHGDANHVFYGPDNQGLNLLLMSNLYGDSSILNPAYQWIDDLELWDQSPCTTLPCGAGGETFSACDVNGDGSTNVVDVQLEVNQALAMTSCTADINKDGMCNVIDVQRVVNAALGGACVSP